MPNPRRSRQYSSINRERERQLPNRLGIIRNTESNAGHWPISHERIVIAARLACSCSKACRAISIDQARTIGQHDRKTTHSVQLPARPHSLGKCSPSDGWSASANATAVFPVVPHPTQRHSQRGMAIELRASATAQVYSRTEFGESAINSSVLAIFVIRRAIATMRARGPIRLAVTRVPRRSRQLRDSREFGVFVESEHLPKSMRQAEERRRADHRDIIHFRKNLPQGFHGRKFHGALELSCSPERSRPSMHGKSLLTDAIILRRFAADDGKSFPIDVQGIRDAGDHNRTVGETEGSGIPNRSALTFPLSPHAASGYAEPHGRRMGTRVE